MPAVDPWVESAAAAIAGHAERELEALVAVSSPSGDVRAAEESIALVTALLPAAARVVRPACSTEGFAPDLLASLEGTGSRSVLLLGHLDTVIAHAEHRPLAREGELLVGSGAIDMKGGVVLSLGVLRELAARPELYRRVALLLVNDEEWRIGDFSHRDVLRGFDVCLCFEGGERDADGREGAVVRRKAAATLETEATGASSHSGSAPDAGRNALLALSYAAQAVAALHDPGGPDRLSAVPTVIRSGDAFNVVPGSGTMCSDLRADSLEAVERALATLPREAVGVELDWVIGRRWPGLDSREVTAPALERAAALLGRPIHPAERGGASDAAWVARDVPLAIDGLGPLGGAAHAPAEFVLASSIGERAEVALAVALAVLQD